MKLGCPRQLVVAPNRTEGTRRARPARPALPSQAREGGPGRARAPPCSLQVTKQDHLLPLAITYANALGYYAETVGKKWGKVRRVGAEGGRRGEARREKAEGPELNDERKGMGRFEFGEGAFGTWDGGLGGYSPLPITFR